VLRRSKRAREQFHPVHRVLVEQGHIAASMTGDDLAGLMASLAVHDQTQRRPLPPALLEFAVPLLRVVATDLAPGGTVDVALDVRGPTKDKQSPRIEIPPTPQQQSYQRIRRIRRTTTVDNWLGLRARMRDRSVLEVTITDTVVENQITKLNQAGTKRKLKRKVRRRQDVRVRLALPPGAPVYDPGGTPPFIRVAVDTDRRRPTIGARARFDLDVPPPLPPLQILLLVVGEPFRWARPPEMLGTA
jgi:hypothetical protein